MRTGRAMDRSTLPGPGLSLLALALGAAAGFAAATWFGPRLREVGAGLGRLLTGDEEEPQPHSSHLASRVRGAFAADPLLASLELEPIPVSAGMVELHGWVATRSERARAWRVARAVPGIESIVNCILVHGEDDPAPGTTTA